MMQDRNEKNNIEMQDLAFTELSQPIMNPLLWHLYTSQGVKKKTLLRLIAE